MSTWATDAITVERVGPVDVITIDDGKANALSPAVLGALSAAVSTAESDTEVRSVVLAGRAGRFSAGFDLSVMQSGDAAAIVGMVSDGGALVRQLYGASIPVVAACTGHALAAGALVLLGCDHRVGADGPFKIGLNEVAIGLTLPGWAMTIATDRLSKRHVQRAVANARITDPAAAVDVGFLDAVAEPDSVVATAVEIATELAALDPSAYARTVSVFRASTLERMDAQLASDRAAVA